MDDLRAAFAALHDEAHGDDKVPFEHCTRQSCKDAHETLPVVCGNCGLYL